MEDYRKIELSHKMSSYNVQIPEWHGNKNIRTPFNAWAEPKGSLTWYQSYNNYKHDRVVEIEKANFGNLIEAWCGLFVLISAQYFLDEFSDDAQVTGFAPIHEPGEFWHGIGGYLKVKFPTNWSDCDKYNFSHTSDNFSNPQFSRLYDYSA